MSSSHSARQGFPLQGAAAIILVVPIVMPLVIDKSGSMDGEKMVLARAAAHEAIRVLESKPIASTTAWYIGRWRDAPRAAIRRAMPTSTPDAAHGRQGASQISVVMKSGTNQLQGTAYTFLRNGALDATNYFAPKGEPDPEYRRAQSGFSIGGPIVPNRAFFFADYEATRDASIEDVGGILNLIQPLEASGVLVPRSVAKGFRSHLRGKLQPLYGLK